MASNVCTVLQCGSVWSYSHLAVLIVGVSVLCSHNAQYLHDKSGLYLMCISILYECSVYALIK
jgi:hypothetical protein